SIALPCPSRCRSSAPVRNSPSRCSSRASCARRCPMNTHFNTLRVRWAGPAVLSVLLGLAVTPRTAVAAVTEPPSAATAATPTMAVACYQEAIAYIDAWIAYIEAWRDYENTLPGGTEQEIMGRSEGRWV